jgi:glycosyltransferase involved in cell wall biosynthesis
MAPLKILVVVHGYPPTAVAGTEICAQRLCVALKEMGHDISVIAREERFGYPEYKIMRDERDGIPVMRIVNNFKKLQERYMYDYHPRIEEIFEDELARLKPDLVHVQHLSGASWGIPLIVKKHGIPLVVSLHDYWYACERVQLLRPDGTICPGPDDGRNCSRYCAHGSLSLIASAVIERLKWGTGFLGACPSERIVLRALAAIQPLAMPRKTKKLRRVYRERCARLLHNLSSADALIAPSEKAREIYEALGIPKERVVVIPHGAPPLPEARAGFLRNEYDGTRSLVVGYIGTVMAHKGVVTLLRAIRGLSPGKVTLRIYGRAYPPRFTRFITKAITRFPRGQVEIQGAYQPEELPRLMAGLDVVVIPSLWHETFNLVLWEAWASRLPVIASRVGALSDFIREGVDGLTFPPGNWRGLRAQLARIVENPALLGTLREELPRSCMSLNENARRYEKIYIRLTTERAEVRNH